MGIKERFVHVTAVNEDIKGNRNRYIIGAHATENDRNGEWGAGLTVLEALTPLPSGLHFFVSADAGLCVSDFAAWLTTNGFWYLFRVKGNAGGIYQRVVEWANLSRNTRTESDLEDCRPAGAKIEKRKLWRLPGLRHSLFPGITEAFVIKKETINDTDSVVESQYFVSSYPREAWAASQILRRILLHWDTETGVFGVKDRTFLEDSVRYKHMGGVKSQVAVLNFACNFFWAPSLGKIWSHKAPLGQRIRFLRENPAYSPLIKL